VVLHHLLVLQVRAQLLAAELCKLPRLVSLAQLVSPLRLCCRRQRDDRL